METNSFFWHQFQSYATWAVMTLSVLGVAYEIFVCSKFLAGLKAWFFRSFVILALIYFTINFSAICYGLWGLSTEPAQYAARPPLWFGGLIRMYSNMSVPLIVFILMRISNYRAMRATEEEQKVLRDAAQIIAFSKAARKAAARALHNSTPPKMLTDSR